MAKTIPRVTRRIGYTVPFAGPLNTGVGAISIELPYPVSDAPMHLNMLEKNQQ